MLDLKALFEKHSGESCHFEREKNPRHQRKDLCAFLLLHELAPNVHDMVSCAEHNEILLDVNTHVVAARATEEQIITLIRCGIVFVERDECFLKFV